MSGRVVQNSVPSAPTSDIQGVEATLALSPSPVSLEVLLPWNTRAELWADFADARASPAAVGSNAVVAPLADQASISPAVDLRHLLGAHVGDVRRI